MDQPKRKQIRLADYDYSSPGSYFVTICTKDRRNILSDIAVGADALGGPCLTLTEIGQIVERYILSTGNIAGLSVDQYVIMPNHIHLLLQIGETDAASEGGTSRASAPTLSDAVGALKRLVNREAGRNIWQRGYYEHVIRNEHDYREIWEYIENNPAKWAEDRYYTE
ncbi:MAG: transposase [Oscillospiraceae bacterium]|nr:transposase [Oscillospiraceae bacterium]